MRSVEEQQALVTASAVAPNPVRVAIQDSPGVDVCRRSRNNNAATRLRPSRN